MDAATSHGASFLGRCYYSLRAQTFRDWQWVVVDDGSTDRTADVMRPIAAGVHASTF
jgi:glycosyltransferase involved in cell wall biosynthesis